MQYTQVTVPPVGESLTKWKTHLAYYNLWMNYGQSNNNGTDGNPALTTEPHGTNKMLNPGIRKKESEGSSGEYTSLVPIQEETYSLWGETGVAAGTADLLDRLAAELGEPVGISIIGAAGGQGSANIATLSKGTTRYGEWLSMAAAAKTIAVGEGKTFSGLLVNMQHGEADQQASRARSYYGPMFRALAADMEGDLLAVSGQPMRPLFLFSQVSCHRYLANSTGSQPRPEIALAQLDCDGGNNGNMFLTRPGYADTFKAAGLHKDNYGHRSGHLYDARAAFKIIKARRDGGAVPPLVVKPKSVLWQDNLIDVEFYVPHGKLQFRTDRIAQCVNQGFDLWMPDGLTLQDIIDDVILFENTHRLLFVCTQVPVAGSRLTAAAGRDTDTTSGPASGVATNLCDSEGDIDTYVDGAGTQRMDNYCVHFELVKP